MIALASCVAIKGDVGEGELFTDPYAASPVFMFAFQLGRHQHQQYTQNNRLPAGYLPHVL
jgi:hypothetical protein